MSPRLLSLLSAVRAHRTLTSDRDRDHARRAAASTFIGVSRPARRTPHWRVTVALHRLRDHAARDARIRIADLRAPAGRG